MFITNRNTYHTRKIMVLYGVSSITCLILGYFGIILISVFKFWWLWVLTILFFLIHVFTFFLLLLENNDYKIKYYFDKKNFKPLYNELIVKYKVEGKKNKKKIKKQARDYFNQYGKIDENANDIGSIIFSDWLERHTYDKYINCKEEEKLDFFIYGLLGVVYMHGDYRENLNNLIKIHDKNEISILLDNCAFIKKPFKEKCMFIYDYPSFVSEKFLKDIYMELLMVTQGIIGLLSEDDFNERMYNPNYYYSEDKKVAYRIEEKKDLYDVIERNFMYEFDDPIITCCKSKEEALSVLKDCLKKYNNEENK